MRNDLNRLSIRCRNSDAGCDVVCNLEFINTHEEECGYVIIIYMYMYRQWSHRVSTWRLTCTCRLWLEYMFLHPNHSVQVVTCTHNPVRVPNAVRQKHGTFYSHQSICDSFHTFEMVDGDGNWKITKLILTKLYIYLFIIIYWCFITAIYWSHDDKG